jgi:hypothetical protein
MARLVVAGGDEQIGPPDGAFFIHLMARGIAVHASSRPGAERWKKLSVYDRTNWPQCRNIGLFRDIFEDFQRKVFVRIIFPNFFQDAEERAGAVLASGDDPIRELLVAQRRLRLGQFGFHEAVPLSWMLYIRY